MSIFATFLTVVLVLNCLLLILLVIIQLPKKEAGAGLAFGGGATDALFGAGSGNALTKLTKYVSASFLGLSVVLAMINIKLHYAGESGVRRALKTAPAASATAPAAPVSSQFQLLGTNAAPLTSATTNAAVAPATNAPAPK